MVPFLIAGHICQHNYYTPTPCQQDHVILYTCLHVRRALTLGLVCSYMVLNFSPHSPALSSSATTKDITAAVMLHCKNKKVSLTYLSIT